MDEIRHVNIGMNCKFVYELFAFCPRKNNVFAALQFMQDVNGNFAAVIKICAINNLLQSP